MEITTHVIDTFTSTRFKGNPTAVCVLTEDIEVALMHAIAKELPFPVTAFCNITAQNQGAYAIRYFTTTGEIPACGHATLATAQVVFELTGSNSCAFTTSTNILLHATLAQAIIYLTYPVYQATPFAVSGQTLASMGLTTVAEALFCAELETLFLVIEQPSVLKTLAPDYKAMVASNHAIKEIVVTSISDDSKFDFLLRSFCPWIGIDEDPVTGSVHSFLAGYWKAKLNKQTLVAYQASERGGEVYLACDENSVALGGKTVTVLKGQLTL